MPYDTMAYDAKYLACAKCATERIQLHEHGQCVNEETGQTDTLTD